MAKGVMARSLARSGPCRKRWAPRAVVAGTIVLLLAGAMVTLGSSEVAGAATQTVSNCNDSGAGCLRQANRSGRAENGVRRTRNH
jgi:hypothetical protein